MNLGQELTTTEARERDRFDRLIGVLVGVVHAVLVGNGTAFRLGLGRGLLVEKEQVRLELLLGFDRILDTLPPEAIRARGIRRETRQYLAREDPFCQRGWIDLGKEYEQRVTFGCSYLCTTAAVASCDGLSRYSFDFLFRARSGDRM